MSNNFHLYTLYYLQNTTHILFPQNPRWDDSERWMSMSCSLGLGCTYDITVRAVAKKDMQGKQQKQTKQGKQVNRLVQKIRYTIPCNYTFLKRFYPIPFAIYCKMRTFAHFLLAFCFKA